ncbi:MAG: hydroxymethylglutaryl-CoA synthase, partial [Candidatus Aenigmatarchaeota archaeon]
FEKSRKMSPGHLTEGLKIKKMAVPDAHEDSMTMAAMAVMRLLEQNNLQPKDIGRFEVATETSYDEAKAANTYIIGMLEQVYGYGSCKRWGGVERKAACASGGYAVYDVCNWIRAKENEGKKGIVVATDIAKYEIGTTGEYTQGGGSVAYLITEDPRLISFERGTSAYVTINERDFFRPFGKITAVFDGHYSNLCYMFCMREAFDFWKEKVLSKKIIQLKEGEAVTDFIDRMVFHVPYPKMVEYALAFLLRHEWRNLPRWKDIINLIGPEPPHKEGTIETILKDEIFMKADNEFRRKFVKTKFFEDVYKEKVKSSTKIPEEVANIYTGSIGLAMLSLFEVEYKAGIELAGKRIGQGFYGSGATALVIDGIISENYKEAAKKFDMLNELEKRKKISIEEYEDLHEMIKEKDSKSKFFILHGIRRRRKKLKESIIPPREEFALVGIGRTGNEKGYRYYKFIE